MFSNKSTLYKNKYLIFFNSQSLDRKKRIELTEN